MDDKMGYLDEENNQEYNKYKSDSDWIEIEDVAILLGIKRFDYKHSIGIEKFKIAIENLGEKIQCKMVNYLKCNHNLLSEFESEIIEIDEDLFTEQWGGSFYYKENVEDVFDNIACKKHTEIIEISNNKISTVSFYNKNDILNLFCSKVNRRDILNNLIPKKFFDYEIEKYKDEVFKLAEHDSMIFYEKSLIDKIILELKGTTEKFSLSKDWINIDEVWKIVIKGKKVNKSKAQLIRVSVELRRLKKYIKYVSVYDESTMNKTNFFYNKEDILNFINTKISKDEVINKYFGNRNNFNNIKKQCNLKEIQLGNVDELMIYETDDIKDMILILKNQYIALNTNEKWISIDEVSEKFGLKKTEIKYKLNLKKLKENIHNHINSKKAYNMDLMGNPCFFYSKDDMEKFAENRISKQIILDNYVSDVETFNKVILEYKLKETSLGRKYTLIFYDRADIKYFIYDKISNKEDIANIFRENMISRKEIINRYFDNKNTFDQIKIQYKLKEVKIDTNDETILYKMKDINQVMVDLKKEYIEITKNKQWILIGEVSKEFGMNQSEMMHEQQVKELEEKLIKIDNYIQNRTVYDMNLMGKSYVHYNRHDVQKFMKDKISKKSILDRYGINIKLLDKIILEFRLKEISLGNEDVLKFYSATDVECYIENKINRKEVIDKYFGDKNSFKKIERKYKLNRINLGNNDEMVLFEIKDINQLVANFRIQFMKIQTDTKWILIEEVSWKFGLTQLELNYEQIKELEEKLMKIDRYIQNKTVYDMNLMGKPYVYYNKHDMEKFIKNRISKQGVLENYIANGEFFDNIAFKYKLKELSLGFQSELIFYDRADIKKIFYKINEKFYRIKSSEKWIELEQVGNLLGLTNEINNYEIHIEILYKNILEFEKKIKHCRCSYIVNKIYKEIYFFNKNDIEVFILNTVCRQKILEILGGRSNKLIEFEKLNKLSIIKLGKLNLLQFYNKKHFEKKKVNYDKNLYLNIYEIFNKYYDKERIFTQSFILNLNKSLQKLPDEMIKFKVLQKPYIDLQNGVIVEKVYEVESIDEFFEKYILLEKAYEQFKIETFDDSIHKVTFSTYIKNLNVITINLGNITDNYILKYDLKRIIEKYQNREISFRKYIEKNNFYILIEVTRLLNLSEKMMNKLIDEQTLEIDEIYNTVKCFKKEKIDKIFIHQRKLLKVYKNNYISRFEIEKNFNGKFSVYISGYRSNNSGKLEQIQIGTLFSGYYKSSDKWLYSKNDVYRIYEIYNKDRLMNDTRLDDKFEEFVFKVEKILMVNISESQSITKKMWYEFIEKQLIKSKNNDINRVTAKVNQYVRNTEKIFSIFTSEIFKYSAIQINKLYLNEDSQVERSLQRDFFVFLRVVNNTVLIEANKIIFNFNELNDPRDYDKIVEQDTGIYSYEEYKELLMFCNNVEYHKEKSLKYIDIFTKTGNSLNYESIWLYIIIHMFNTLRNRTIISRIPRIDLSVTNIKSLEWLEKNTPSIQDANNIIYQINRVIMHISKSSVNAKSRFTIGEPYKIAFATAISICEFRKQQSIKNENILIDIGRQISYESALYKEFFSSFKLNLKFRNRKMNRTLLNFFTQIGDSLNDKGLDMAAVARSHLSTETTKIYAKLTDEQLEFMIKNLFENNFFGFVPKILLEVLNEQGLIKEYSMKNIEVITETFGDFDKIEVSLGIINRISSEQEEIREYIKKLDINEVYNIYLKFLSELLPSRKQYYQCVYKNCKYYNSKTEQYERDCSQCQAAICNIYSLTLLMNLYIDKLEEISKEFDNAIEGEKKRMANHFYLLHDVVQNARKKFGKDVVNNFAEGGVDRIRDIAKKINESKIRKFKSI